MDVKSLLHDSPSDDHRRRQEIRGREDRDRERDRERERERDRREREVRGRDWYDEQLRLQREQDRRPVQRSPSRPFSPVANAASSAPSPLPSFGHRSAHREHEYDSYPPMAAPRHEHGQHGHSRSYGYDGPPPPAGPGLPPPPQAHSSSSASAPAPGPPLFQSPLSTYRDPPMMGPGAPPEYASDYEPRERKQNNMSQSHSSQSRQGMGVPGKSSAPPLSPYSREYERERGRERDGREIRERERERERRTVIAQAHSPSYTDFNREQDRRHHSHPSRSPVDTFSGAPQQQQPPPPPPSQQHSPPLSGPHAQSQTTGSPSGSAASASIHKSPALHNHHAHGHGQAPGHPPNASRRTPTVLHTPTSLPPPPSISPVSGRRVLENSATPVGSQAPAMNSLRPYDSEPPLARHRDAGPLMASATASTPTPGNGRDRDRDREQRERDRLYASGHGAEPVAQRQRERERTLKDDIDREREFYERQKRLDRSAASGQHISPPMHQSMGRDPRDRENENERTRREDMDTIRAAAANRHGLQYATKGQRDREVYSQHMQQPYPPQHAPPHHQNHPLREHPHSHPHSHQQSLPPNPTAQQAHQYQFPLSHSPQPLQAQPKQKAEVLKLAPPGVEVTNNPPHMSTGRPEKQETLTLLPPAHAQAHAQQQQQQQQATRMNSSEQNGLSQAQAPNSPTLPLRLAPDQPYINVQPPQMGHGAPNHPSHSAHSSRSAHPGKHELSNKYSVVPTGPGGPPPPPNAGPSSQPPAASVISMMKQPHAHDQRQRQQEQQLPPQFGGPAPPHMHHRHSHSHEPPTPSGPSTGGHPHSMSVHQQQPPQGLSHHHRVPHPQSAHLHPHPHPHGPPGPVGGPPPPQGYPHPHQLQQVHQYSHGDPLPMPHMTLPLPPPSPGPEPVPTEPPLHLGTYVFPRTPFPYFFPAVGEQALAAQQARRASDREQRVPSRREPDAPPPERETHVTILVSSSYLPSSRPKDGRPRVWGGGTNDGQTQDRHSYYRYTPPRPSRRIYTDDSDLVLCALHAGRVTWLGIQRARTARLDLELRLRVVRDVGRYVGGASAAAGGDGGRGYVGPGGEQDVDLGLEKQLRKAGVKESGFAGGEENWLQSASWESGHDGSGIEVIRAEWVTRSSAHSLGLRNRSQRLLEYAERRQDIMSTSSLPSARVLGKRPAARLDSLDRPRSALPIGEEEKELMGRTVIFGQWNGSDSLGFKYDPMAVRHSLFPSLSTSTLNITRRRKRRKLIANADNAEYDAETDTTTDVEKPSYASKDVMILENDEERFLFTLTSPTLPSLALTKADKENIDHSFQEEASRSSGKGKDRGRHYNIYVLPSSSSKVNGVETKLTNGAPTNDHPTSNFSTESKKVASLAGVDLGPAALKELQLLHSDVSEDALDFQSDGLAVLPSHLSDSTNTLNGSTAEKAWFMHVQRWRWVRR